MEFLPSTLLEAFYYCGRFGGRHFSKSYGTWRIDPAFSAYIDLELFFSVGRASITYLTGGDSDELGPRRGEKGLRRNVIHSRAGRAPHSTQVGGVFRNCSLRRFACPISNQMKEKGCNG
jgi:hypothetical protein